MDSKEVKEYFKIISKKVDTDGHKFDLFQSNFGKEFESNAQDLFKFVTTVGLLPTLAKVFSNIFKTGKSKAKMKTQKFLEETKDKYKDNPEVVIEIGRISKDVEEKGIFPIVEKQEESKEGFFDFFKNAKIHERINAYFFLTFYTYSDLYIMSLFQYVISKLDVTKTYDIIDGFKPFSNPARRLNHILKNLETESKTNLLEILLTSSKYDNDFHEFIKLRNIIAHREPIEAYNEIKIKFPKLVSKAKKQLSKDKKRIIQAEFKDFLDHEEYKRDLEILTVMTFIGRNCYIHLAMVDYLINEYFNSVSS